MGRIYIFFENSEKARFAKARLPSTSSWRVWQSWQAWNITKFGSTFYHHPYISETLTAARTYESISSAQGTQCVEIILIVSLNNFITIWYVECTNTKIENILGHQKPYVGSLWWFFNGKPRSYCNVAKFWNFLRIYSK